MRYLLIACLAVLVAPVASAQITVGPFAEAVGQEQPVSGRGFVGVVLADAAGPIALDKLEVFIPKGTTGALKVSVIAADAKYRGTVDASVGGDASGWTPLKLKSNHQQVLSGYSTDTLTLLAETASEQPLLTRLNANARTVQIYVNSERSETSVAWRKDGKIEVQPCRRLTGGSLVRFDTICAAPTDILGLEPVRIIRRRGGVALEPVVVPLAGLQ
ncbi:MAG TPA: hypothetical protein VFV70_15025 [Hyphomonadaceae bacterium]|nr:hypothetical protein [Hyphomonadaceae bacterium]